MMSLGYLGNGGPSSSSSNLSPLAPPFTVDRSNPKSNSNPLVNFTEPPSYGVPFDSSLHNWPYPHASASRPDFFSNCDSEVDSIRTTSLPSANDYRGSESINPPGTHWAPPNPNATNPTNQFSYLAAPKQYYPPYASQVVDDDAALVSLNEGNYDLLSTSGFVPMIGSSQGDYTQGLSGFEFQPPWVGCWNGLAEGKGSKRTEADGIFGLENTNDSCSHVYKDYMKQGAVAVECLRKCEENPAHSHRKYNDVLGRENLKESLSKGKSDDKFLVQNIGFPNEPSKTRIFGSSTISTESDLESPSLESASSSYNSQKSLGPYDKRFQLFDHCINDCKSVTKSSPTLVIRPPSFRTKPSASDAVSSKSIDIGNVAAVKSKDVGSHNQSIEREPLLPPSFEVKEGCLDANHLDFHISRNDHQIFAASSSNKEEPIKPISRSALDQEIKARFGAQVPDINTPHGFSLAVDSTEAFKYTANSSESLDHPNPAEDSPCWKGAPASQYSPFVSLEVMPPQNVMEKLEARDNLNFQGTQMIPSFNDSVIAFSREVCETNLQKEGLCTDNCMSLLSKRYFNANFPAKEHMVSDAATAKSDTVELNRSDKGQFSDNFDNPIKEHDLHNVSKTDSGSILFHAKQRSPEEVKFTSKRKLDLQAGVGDATFSNSDTSEDGCVPLHAAENVLCSPPSGEVAVKLHGMDSSPKMNVHILVNSMLNLSQLLLFHCLNDKCALTDQDFNALEHAIRNMDSCLSKKIVQSAPTQESMFSRDGISQILEEGASEARPQAMNEVGIASHGLLDSYCTNEQNRKCDASGNKYEKILGFVSSRDDADITRHHNMVQDIRKALDENFQLEEDIPSETLLYKNLWLDAEAELCSNSFRARFERVKIQMENSKSDKGKENLMAVEKNSSSKVTLDQNVTHVSISDTNGSPRQRTSVQYSCNSSPTSHVDDVEASVMARFHILKCRGDNSITSNVEEKQLPEVVDAEFSAKRNHWQEVGNLSGNKSFDVAVGSLSQHHSSHNNEAIVCSILDGPQHETLKEFRASDTDDPVIQPYRKVKMQNQLASGADWYDNPPSDWEHVLKDDFAWQI